MGRWLERVVPRLTDAALSSAEIAEFRVKVCEGLTGNVIELGFGSGLNLPHMPACVDGVDAVEPSDLGWSRSHALRSASPLPVERIGLDARAIDATGPYDAALVTFSLCTISHPADALAEVLRLVKPGGRLHFLEHGLSPDPGVARWQRRLDGVQRTLCGGCHLSRDVPGLITAAGFEIDRLEERHLQPGPAIIRPWSYGYLGTAVRT